MEVEADSRVSSVRQVRTPKSGRPPCLDDTMEQSVMWSACSSPGNEAGPPVVLLAEAGTGSCPASPGESLPELVRIPKPTMPLSLPAPPLTSSRRIQLTATLVDDSHVTLGSEADDGNGTDLHLMVKSDADLAEPVGLSARITARGFQSARVTQSSRTS